MQKTCCIRRHDSSLFTIVQRYNFPGKTAMNKPDLISNDRWLLIPRIVSTVTYGHVGGAFSVDIHLRGNAPKSIKYKYKPTDISF